MTNRRGGRRNTEFKNYQPTSASLCVPLRLTSDELENGPDDNTSATLSKVVTFAYGTLKLCRGDNQKNNKTKIGKTADDHSLLRHVFVYLASRS